MTLVLFVILVVVFVVPVSKQSLPCSNNTFVVFFFLFPHRYKFSLITFLFTFYVGMTNVLVLVYRPCLLCIESRMVMMAIARIRCINLWHLCVEWMIFIPSMACIRTKSADQWKWYRYLFLLPSQQNLISRAFCTSL